MEVYRLQICVFIKSGLTGKTKLERLTKSHTEQNPNAVYFARNLTSSSKQAISESGRLKIDLGIRLLSFCDVHAEMARFAQYPIELRKPVRVHIKADKKSYLLGKTAVSNAFEDLARSLRTDFVDEMKRDV